VSEAVRRRRFERLFDETYDRVLAFALRRTDADAAQDVAAETFAVAWRRLDVVPDEEPIGWLLGVARNVLSHQHRSSGRRAALDTRIQLTTPTASGDPAQDVADLDALGRAFAALGEREREVLRLVAWDELEAPEAAAALGVSVGTFQVRLHRARKRLERELERTRDDVTMAGGTR
jgi:RNA polymerase sigma-70 factor (ECF subfamily)